MSAVNCLQALNKRVKIIPVKMIKALRIRSSLTISRIGNILIVFLPIPINIIKKIHREAILFFIHA